MELTQFFLEAKPIVVVFHALAAAVGLGAVVTTDMLFFRFLKDFKISRKEADTLDTISKLIWAAIFVLFITGLMLYLSAPMDYSAKSKFVTKVIIYALIVLNGVALNKIISPYLIKLSFDSDSAFMNKNRRLRILRRIAFASGAFSMISWFTVFILGSIRSIPLNVGQALGVYTILILGGVIGSQIFALFLKKHRTL